MSYRRRKQTIEEDEAQPVEGEQMKASTLAKTALLGGLNLQEGNIIDIDGIIVY